MIRKIIHIDQEKCTGCGLCAKTCHEGAIEMVNGKAMLVREHFCDGLGDCLPACPADAISFEEREAPAYDAEAVQQSKAHMHHEGHTYGMSCPGAAARELNARVNAPKDEVGGSWLANWPVQIKLAPVRAPYFNGADLLIAADCTAYAYAGMHQKFMRGRVTLIGCSKLDNEDYSEKLSSIFAANDIRSIHIVRMEVPCCGGLVNMVNKAVQMSGKQIPVEITVFSLDGHIL